MTASPPVEPIFTNARNTLNTIEYAFRYRVVDTVNQCVEWMAGLAPTAKKPPLWLVAAIFLKVYRRNSYTNLPA